jgi:DedD protein
MAQERTTEEGVEIRRKALIRLVVAGVVTLVALGALWWLDSDGKDKAKPKPGKAPSPIIAAQAPITTDTAPAVLAAPEPPVETVPPIQPPPPPVVNTPAATPEPSPTTRAPNRSPALASTPEKKPASEAPSPTPAKSATPSTFVVQLGVFTDPTNARELVERLNKLGVRAQMETRVQVGPFNNRLEADKARAEIARLGVKGVVATK